MAAGPGATAESEPRFVVQRYILTSGQDGEVPGAGQAIEEFKVNPNRWAREDIPLAVTYNPAGAPAGGDIAALIQTAAGKWSAIDPATFSFAWAGISSGEAGTCADGAPDLDGLNTVTFANGIGSTTLGITCTVWDRFAGPGAPLAEFDMQLNAAVDWGFGDTLGPGEFDLASTVLHELGHAAGIGHPCASAPGCSDAEKGSVMYPSLRAREQRRTLTQDDIDALIAAYQRLTLQSLARD